MPYPNGRRRKTKPAANQDVLPFGVYKERFALLDAISHERAGLTRVRWRNCRAFLKAVHHFDRHENGCWASATKIDAQAELSRDQRLAAQADAVELGVLTVERRGAKGIGKGRQSNLLTIDWKAVSGLGLRSDSSALRSDFPRLTSENPTYIEEEVLRRDSERNTNPPPQPSAPLESHADETRDPWPAVEEELFKTGVNQANAACEAARQQGATPDDVRALIAHWRPRQAAWGDHAQAELYRRVQRATRGEPPHHGWPAYAQDASTLQARQLDNREAAKRHSLRKASEQRWQSTRRELTSAQQRIIGDEVRRRWPYLAAPGVDRNRLVSEGVLRLFDDLGEQGIAKLLERSQPHEAPGFVSARPP